MPIYNESECPVMFVMGIYVACLYNFPIAFSNCSDSVVSLVKSQLILKYQLSNPIMSWSIL